MDCTSPTPWRYSQRQHRWKVRACLAPDSQAWYPVGLKNSSGAVLNSYSYDPYGISTNVSGAKCVESGLVFQSEDLKEIDHIDPTAGEKIMNKQLLHRHCHDRKTVQMGDHLDHGKANKAQ